MSAIVYEKYGSPDVLQIKEVEKPVPKENEVLIKVQAASVNPGDWHALRGEPFLQRLESGFPYPKNDILGADVAGRVEAVGKNVRTKTMNTKERTSLDRNTPRFLGAAFLLQAVAAVVWTALLELLSELSI